MKRYLHLTRKRRHELMAGAFAILFSIWLLQHLASSGCIVKTDRAPAIVNTLAPLLGVWSEEPVTADVLARSAEDTSSVSAPEANTVANEPTVTPAEASAKPVTPSERKSMTSTDETKPLDARKQEEDRLSEHHNKDVHGASPEREDEEVVTLDEVIPVPNPVEGDPKPIDEMAPEDVTETFQEYAARLRRGRITLKLDYTKLPADRLHLVASYYLLSTPATTLRIQPGGEFELLSAADVPTDQWVCDLPLDRKRWPSEVARRAALAFGQFYSLRNANFLLTDEFALKLFRFLAQVVGDKEPVPGTVFVIRLDADDLGRIRVELVN